VQSNLAKRRSGDDSLALIADRMRPSIHRKVFQPVLTLFRLCSYSLRMNSNRIIREPEALERLQCSLQAPFVLRGAPLKSSEFGGRVCECPPMCSTLLAAQDLERSPQTAEVRAAQRS